MFLTFDIQLGTYVSNVNTILGDNKKDQYLKISSDSNLMIPDKILKIKNDHTTISFVLPSGDKSKFGGGKKINYLNKYLKYKNKYFQLKNKN
jgi:hypothetical protein